MLIGQLEKVVVTSQVQIKSDGNREISEVRFKLISQKFLSSGVQIHGDGRDPERRRPRGQRDALKVRTAVSHLYSAADLDSFISFVDFICNN